MSNGSTPPRIPRGSRGSSREIRDDEERSELTTITIGKLFSYIQHKL